MKKIISITFATVLAISSIFISVGCSEGVDADKDADAKGAKEEKHEIEGTEELKNIEDEFGFKGQDDKAPEKPKE